MREFLIELVRYVRTLAMAVSKPAKGAGDAVSTAAALLTSLGFPLAVTVIAQQTQDSISSLTGLNRGLVPWAAFSSAFLSVGGFLAWRRADREVRELASRLIPTLEHRFIEKDGVFSVSFENKCEREIEKCELRLVHGVNFETGLETDDALPFRERGGSTKFSIPPLGRAWVEVLSLTPNGYTLALKESPPPKDMSSLKSGELRFQIQAANMLPISFTYAIKAKQPVAQQQPPAPQVAEISLPAAIEILKGNLRRPKKTLAADLSLYVGDMRIGTSRLAEDQIIEISCRGTNTTGHSLKIIGLWGNVRVEAPIVGQSSAALSAPVLPDRFRTAILRDHWEFVVAIEQRLPAEVVARLLNLSDDAPVTLDLRELDIMVASDADPSVTARLPLWGAMRLTGSPRNPNCGRVIFATINAQLGPVRAEAL